MTEEEYQKLLGEAEAKLAADPDLRKRMEANLESIRRHAQKIDKRQRVSHKMWNTPVTR